MMAEIGADNSIIIAIAQTSTTRRLSHLFIMSSTDNWLLRGGHSHCLNFVPRLLSESSESGLSAKFGCDNVTFFLSSLNSWCWLSSLSLLKPTSLPLSLSSRSLLCFSLFFKFCLERLNIFVKLILPGVDEVVWLLFIGGQSALNRSLLFCLRTRVKMWLLFFKLPDRFVALALRFTLERLILLRERLGVRRFNTLDLAPGRMLWEDLETGEKSRWFEDWVPEDKRMGEE